MKSLGVILAAGGVVYRTRPGPPEFLLIHRHRHQDWCLPKGKHDKSETLEQTAVREVHEETGWTVRVRNYLGATGDPVSGTPKVVLFWLMEAAEKTGKPDPGEVDDVVWLPAGEARRRLDYESERFVLDRAVESVRQ